MRYSKIKLELEKRHIPFKSFCKKIGVSEQGLHQMIRNRSMKISTLERISDMLHLDMSYWFDDVYSVRSYTDEVSEGRRNNYRKYTTEELKEMLSVLFEYVSDTGIPTDCD